MEAKKLGITTVLFESPLRISQLLLSIGFYDFNFDFRQSLRRELIDMVRI